MQRWSEEDKRLLCELFPTQTSTQLAPVLGRSAHSIRQMAAALGIEKTVHATKNCRPIGSERMDRGILIRKVTDHHRNKKDWRRVDELMWEAVHGPIPPGFHLMLVDGNGPRTLENLALFTKQGHLERVSVHALPPEVADLCRLKGQITKEVRRRIREETEAP